MVDLYSGEDEQRSPLCHPRIKCSFLTQTPSYHLISILSIPLHSNRWSQISAQLPGRTANCVKNKWNGSKKIRRAGIIGAAAAAKATATAKSAAVITTPEKIAAPVDVVVVPHANYTGGTSKMPPTSPLAISPSVGNEASPSANDYSDRDGYYPQDELDENAMPPALAGVTHHYTCIPPPVPSPVQEEPLPALGLPTIEAEPLSTEDSIRHPHLFTGDNAAVPSNTSQHDISIAEALLAMISPPTKEVSAMPLADMTSPVGNMMSLQNWPGPSKMPDASSPADRSDWFGPGVLGGAPV